MDPRDRSLDVESGDSSAGGGIWTVVSDIALSLVLVLVLFVLAQFLHYDEVFVLEEIDRRRQAVQELVMSAAGGVLTPAELDSLEVGNVGFTTQRIRFPETMLFGSCEVDPRPRGVLLIEAVGRAIAAREAYFEAIQIEGHADQRPPGPECARRITDNWGLSSARATAFVRVLINPDVFPEANRISAVGRGDTQPLTSDSSSLPNDARHRRIELVLIFSEEDARHTP